MYGIYNKYGCRMDEFGSFGTWREAYCVLRKSIDRYPDAGLRVKKIESAI